MVALRKLPRSALFSCTAVYFCWNCILTAIFYRIDVEQKKLAAMELGHLMRSKGVQKPIDISVELTDDAQKL